MQHKPVLFEPTNTETDLPGNSPKQQPNHKIATPPWDGLASRAPRMVGPKSYTPDIDECYLNPVRYLEMPDISLEIVSPLGSIPAAEAAA
jgi:hypothetical protein